MKLKIFFFLAEIRKRELISKNIIKDIASLDCFDKSSNVLSILSPSISIASFATVVGVPAGIIGASCGFMFSITSGFVKKFVKTNFWVAQYGLIKEVNFTIILLKNS